MKDLTEKPILGHLLQMTTPIFVGMLTLVCGYGFGRAYVGTLGSDAAMVSAGVTYLYWFLPSLGL